MAAHDNAYKDLFSHREMVADLIRAFIPLPWAQQVDLGTLERVNASYVERARRDRESDVVWRFKLSGEWAYVYLLLEFQSTVDPTMALRMVLYRTLLALDLVKSKQVPPGGPFPHIFPVVLYNGERPWRAALEVADLFPPALSGSEGFTLRGRYLLIDERALASAPLSSTQNLVAAVFALEQSRDAEDVLRVVRALIEALRDPAQESLRRTFAAWIHQVMLPAHFPAEAFGPKLPLQEVETMLAERVQRWYREQREQGRSEGRSEGQRLMATRAAVRLIEARFGAPSTATLARLDAMSEEQLLDLLPRVAAASSIDEALGG